MDVHPPLAKLLITLAGWLAGFNGDFDFKEIGKDYLEPGVPYVAMRLLPAIMGVLTIPTIFLTLKATGCRTSTAAFGAALLIFGQCLHDGFDSVLMNCRKWSSHTIAPYPSRLPIDHFHSIHSISVHMLHQSARARSNKSIRCNLVVLAGCYWSRSWCYSQCQMGRTVHNCLDRESNNSTTLGLDRRFQDCYYQTFHQAFARQSFLLDLYSNRFLHGFVRHPFHMSCQPRRWRRFHVIGIPSNS